MIENIINKIHAHIRRLSNPLKAFLIYIGFLVFFWVVMIIGRIFVPLSRGFPVMEFGNFFVLFTTFWAIVWYTLETVELKELQKAANNIEISPLLILDTATGRTCLKNIGRGLANNINIHDCIVSEYIKFKFDCNRIIAPNSYAGLGCSINNMNNLQNVDFMMYLKKNSVRLELNYYDINNNGYCTILGISDGVVSILSHEKLK